VKPPAFHYAAPATLGEALKWRAEELDSVVLNGGQSLVATMNFRLSSPDLVIDLRNVRELDYTRLGDGWVRIGGTAKQRVVEEDPAIRAAQPLLHAALQFVAHPVIRNRGSVCGSLAHADPSAELPMLFAMMRGQMTAAGPDGERTIEAADFFEFIFTTALEPEELLVEAALPVLQPGEGWAFSEFARRHGDYAVAGVGATVRIGRDGTIDHARLGACGIATTPSVLEECEQALVGQTATPELFAQIAEVAKESVTVSDDSTTSKAYRQHVLAGLVRKNLTTATERAAQ
jgi:carbon-monoxide dehydrogenase medium subunit